MFPHTHENCLALARNNRVGAGVYKARGPAYAPLAAERIRVAMLWIKKAREIRLADASR